MEIKLEQKILARNDQLAARNADTLASKGIYMLNLLASPGSGKTSLILATIKAMGSAYRIAVIEGDIASDVDSQKVKAAGVPAVQINTGGACHLESNMVERALEALPLEDLDLIVVENVGNLVCPVDFELGEDAKAMILSVPEGHDKPLKYPGVFQASKAVVLNKIDVMPAFDFDEAAFARSVRDLNPQAPIFKVAATKGEGMKAWCAWLEAQIDAKRAGQEGAMRDHGRSALS
jgi:hydrogenase nickel incorporation protein HypB